MTAQRTRGHRLAIVRGILIPVAWDQEGNVLAVGLAGIDEKEYLIDNHKELKGLLRLLRTEVEIRGVLRREAGKQIIAVTSFSHTSAELDGAGLS